MHATLCGDRAPRRTSGRRLTMRARRACGEPPMSCECPWGEGDLVPFPGHAPRRNPCPRVLGGLCGPAACGWDDDGTRHRAARQLMCVAAPLHISTFPLLDPHHPATALHRTHGSPRHGARQVHRAGARVLLLRRYRVRAAAPLSAPAVPRRRAAQPDGSRPLAMDNHCCGPADFPQIKFHHHEEGAQRPRPHRCAELTEQGLNDAARKPADYPHSHQRQTGPRNACE